MGSNWHSMGGVVQVPSSVHRAVTIGLLTLSTEIKGDVILKGAAIIKLMLLCQMKDIMRVRGMP